MTPNLVTHIDREVVRVSVVLKASHCFITTKDELQQCILVRRRVQWGVGVSFID